MIINVDKDNVSISKEQVHSGEFNINPLDFVFSEEYTDNLVKKVVFTTVLDGSFSETIIDNKASIPYEITQKVGNVLVGVYAYEITNNELVLRYSPNPIYLTIEQGSFVDAQDGTVLVPALTIEQYEQALNEILTNFEIDKDKIVNDIVKESEQEFDEYFDGKEQEFDEHINEYEKTWRGSQAEYDQLQKDNNTQYFIEEE